MADDENNEFDEDDFSGSFADDDFSSTDLFGEDISSDDVQTEAESDTGFDFGSEDDMLSEPEGSDDSAFDTDDSAEYSQFGEKFQDGGLKKIAIPAAIGVFVLVIIIYGATRLFSGGGSSPTTTAATTTNPTSSVPIKMSGQPGTTTATPPAPKSEKSSQEIELPPLQMQKAAKQLKQGAQEITKLQESIGGLQADMKSAFEKTGGDVEKVQQDMSDLQTQAVQNAQAIQSLTKQLTTITNKVDEVGATMDKMIKTIKQAAEIESQRQQAMTRSAQPPSMQQTGGPPAQSPPAYYVQAIIPGRAWLKDAAGKVISVGIGDQIPGFGAVTQINTRAGTVQTNSGVTIEYGISQY